ncbi:DUF3370 domain-containing protein, partial [Romeria aff. gracilis LEGE 07310]
SPPTAEPVEIIRPQTVRSLPAQLDDIPVFNSNSPELIGTPGILLSTFPPEGKAVPEAHLNLPFDGRFDVFAHHVYKAETPEQLTSLYLGILVYNPGSQPVAVDVLAGASYLSQPDAPFIELPDRESFGPFYPIFAGPGSRVMGDILRGERQAELPGQLVIPPGESAMLLNQPIPVRSLDPPINGRSTLLRLRSSGPVYLASLARPAVETADGEEAPSLEDWQTLLDDSGLAGPRDRAPTPPDSNASPLIYGRVAGVAQGSEWQATLTDSPVTDRLTIPAGGEAFSYGISLLPGGRLGTNQNQSAPLLVRYPDTAYQAHGNYGIQYSLTLPLYNPTDQPQTVTVALETPIKEDLLTGEGLRFLTPPAQQMFFRGPVQVRYQDDRGLPRIVNYHLVQRRGQLGDPLATLTIAPQTSRTVEVDLLYPPDSTPPQVITVQTQQSP